MPADTILETKNLTMRFGGLTAVKAFSAAIPCSRLSNAGMASMRTLPAPNSSTSNPHRRSWSPWECNALQAAGGISMMIGVSRRWLSSAPAVNRAEMRS